MHRVKVGRRCDNDGVDFFGRENFVIGIRPDEELFGIEAGKLFCLLNFVEMLPAVSSWSGEIGKRNDPRGAGIDKIAGIFRARGHHKPSRPTRTSEFADVPRLRTDLLS